MSEVDWSARCVAETMQRYFGQADAPTRCSSGTPIYQYIYTLDVARSRYMLHLDDDMLAHLANGGRWIFEAIEWMAADPNVVVVTPEGGPPVALGWRGWLVGRSRRQPR